MKKFLTLALTALLLQSTLFAQDFVVNNPLMSPNPGVFPGGTETVTFDFYVAQSSFTFSNDALSNDYAFITFSFTKLNPTNSLPSGTGSSLFNWVLSNNGGFGAGLVYTWTGTTKTVTMNASVAVSTPAPKYKITFADVPITLGATQGESDIRVAGQFTDPGNAPTGNSGNNNASIATYTAAGALLPTSLLDFTAVKKIKVVDLNWQTSTEQNSSYFNVEFSKDGSEFSSIGKVNASGSSTTSKNYTLVHSTPVNGINYYRLKMVDVGGLFKYSTVRTVKFSSTKTIKIMPNPTADRVYITSNEGGVLQSVGVYSMDGKLLHQVTNFALGKSIDLSTYAPSIYILKLIDKDGTTDIIKVVRK